MPEAFKYGPYVSISVSQSGRPKLTKGRILLQILYITIKPFSDVYIRHILLAFIVQTLPSRYIFEAIFYVAIFERVIFQ